MVGPTPVLLTEHVKPLSLQIPRRRISKGQRSLIAEYLDEKYGHKCCYCEATAQLTFEHKDGDRNNTTLQNLAWACPSCQKDRTVVNKSIYLSPNTELRQTPLDKNRECEPAWLDFTRRWTEQVGEIPIKTFIQESSFESNCHPKTAEGYLFKYSAAKGHLIVTKNTKGQRFVGPRRAGP